jgi:hypothetical protein
MTTSVLDHLIAADRIVLAGIQAYDQATARSLDELARNMAKLDYSEEDMAAELAPHKERIRLSRSKLHRELWSKALSMLALSEPGEAES